MSTSNRLPARTLRLAVAPALLALSLALPGGVARAGEVGLENWFPGDVIGLVKLDRTGKTIRNLLASNFRSRVEAPAIFQFIREQEGSRKFLEGLSKVREITGREAVDVIDDLLGEQAIAGLRLSFPPSFLSITRSRSAAALKAGIESLKALLRENNGGTLPPSETSDHDGVTNETIGGSVSHAVKGRDFFISNSVKAVEDMLDLAAGKKTSVADSDAFAAVFSKKTQSDLAVAAIRPAFIPDFRIPEHTDNPLASLLFSGWLETLRISDLLTFRLGHENGVLGLEIQSRSSKDLGNDVDSIFFSPEVGMTDAAELRQLEREGVVGIIHLRRDIAQWWRKRETFMDARTAGGFLEANTFLSIFFGGISFQDEVLPALDPGVTIVSRLLTFEGLETPPHPRLPGFAAIFRLRDPAMFRQRLKSAFYQLVTVSNIENDKNKQLSPFNLGSEKVGDVEIAVAVMNVAENPSGGLGIEYNFSPSVAVLGKRAIISSNREFTRVLARVLAKKPATTVAGKPEAGGVDRITVSARELEKLLQANREFLTNTMVINDGISHEEAQGRVHAIGEIIGLLGGVSLKTAFADRVATLELELRLSDQTGKKVSGTTVKF